MSDNVSQPSPLSALGAKALAVLLPSRKEKAAARLESPGWYWPLEGKPVISDGFHPKGSKERPEGHRGVDICYWRAKAGDVKLPWQTKHFEMYPTTRALAVQAGRVTVARQLRTGWAVCIDHGDGVETAYHHLSEVHVSAGQEAFAGTSLGYVGWNPVGYKFAHLHFDLVVCGSFVDPAPTMRTWLRVPA